MDPRAENVMLFLLQRLGACEERKLYDLVYLLDRECFKATGDTITGLTYEAREDGPVPVEVEEALLNSS